MKDNKTNNYDPTWLVEAAEKCSEEYPWLIAELKNLTKVVKETNAYIYFVNPDNPNEPDSDWQFQENILLPDSIKGEIVLDILVGNRVGGVELLDKLY